jgi:hypothetical protein
LASALVEVAAHGIADLLVELGHGVRFREDRRTEGPSGEPALGSFLYDEDDFTHGG